MEYLQKMKRVQSRLMPNAQVVGWYTTGTKLSPHTATLHDLIVKECAHSCHHLLADCTSSSALGQVQAFYTSDIGAGESSTVGHVFLPFDSVRMLALSEENSAIQSMTTQSNNAMGSQVDTLTASLTSVRDMLDQVLVYTQSVVVCFEYFCYYLLSGPFIPTLFQQWRVLSLEAAYINLLCL